ncbi:YjbH domain-containing protein [Enterobacter ludwigii]|uniref:YjbH domain-containing protein n=1 Tax=Enterobacter ludwigii TaxID=299767 RepID=UPI003D2414DD
MRTRVREYVQNDANVNNLQANYFQYFGNGFYGQVYGGYLETMFGGAGLKCSTVRRQQLGVRS